MARRTKSSLTSASRWRMCSTLGWPCTVPSKPSDAYPLARIIEWEFDYFCPSMFMSTVYVIYAIIILTAQNSGYIGALLYTRTLQDYPRPSGLISKKKTIPGRTPLSPTTMLWFERLRQWLPILLHPGRMRTIPSAEKISRLNWTLKFMWCIPTQTSWGRFVAARGIKLLCETGWTKFTHSNHCHQLQLTYIVLW